ILQPIYRQVRTFAPVFVLLVAVILAGVVLLIRQAREMASKTSLVRMTLENMGQGVFVRSADGTLPIYNRRALELTGLPAEFMAATPTTDESIDYQRRHGEFDNLAPETLAEMKSK